MAWRVLSTNEAESHPLYGVKGWLRVILALFVLGGLLALVELALPVPAGYAAMFGPHAREVARFDAVAAFILAGVALFGFAVLRGLSHALRMHDAFTRLSVCGLIVLFGVQSMINMAVNLHLMPAKGMTLPFISYGGSSLVAVALGMGFVLALTRRRPQTVHIGPFAPEASYAMPHPA